MAVLSGWGSTIAMGFGLLAGRVLHARGLSKTAGRSFGRAAGQLLTWLAMAAASFYAVYLFAIGVGP
ncbi:MAG: hypothetical protein VW709_16265, partial [Rickettsiales bacterium]